MSDAYQIVRRPLITEKNMHRAEARGEYTFEVDQRANKVQIRRAVEELFNVKVARVHTAIKKGIRHRVGWNVVQDPNTKKAVVKLASGYKIELL